MIGLRFYGSDTIAWTEMYATPKGLFPVLGEPITVTKEMVENQFV